MVRFTTFAALASIFLALPFVATAQTKGDFVVCAAVEPCGVAPAFALRQEFAGATGCIGVYNLRCDNLRLAYENQELKKAAKHKATRDRKPKRKK